MASEELSRRDRLLVSVVHSSSFLNILPTAILYFTLGKSRSASDPVTLTVWLIFFAGPAIGFLIWRFFRKRNHLWGSVQSLQATVFLILLSGLGLISIKVEILDMVIVLGIFYGAWGTMDALLGYNFKYIFIGTLAEKFVMNRMEHR